MADAEKVMKGQYLLIEAPNEREAHDDYVDTLALACACSLEDSVPVVETMDCPSSGDNARSPGLRRGFAAVSRVTC